MNAEAFVKAVAPLLKSLGFKKSGATWRRDQDESVAVFNVQKSQWDGGAYYVNIGSYFRALGNDPSPTQNKCHVQTRLASEEPSTVVENAVNWLQARAALRDAALLAESDSKKGLVSKDLRNVTAT